jgi:outer membrane protein OmpA-like peptidoglycan-associated protein
MLLLGGTAVAQTIPIFDGAPTIEQLRSIMIPESQPGLGRTIVIQRPDASAIPSPVQTVASQVMAPQSGPAAQPDRPPAQSVQKVDSAAASPPAARHKADAPSDSGAVGFHINFAFDSAELPQSAHAMIDRIAQLMKETQQIKVRIEGHTDAKGSPGYNMSLSERRALSVGEYLVRQGIDPARLLLVGKGMTEPLTGNPYDPANRRVQFVRIG